MMNFGVIVKPQYVRKSEDPIVARVIKDYELLYAKECCDAFDTKVIGNTFKRFGEDRITNNKLFSQLRSGEYKRVYLIYNSKVETDARRYNSIPSDKLENRYRTKTLKERFDDEYHVQDNRIQVPEKFGDVDGYLHWFVTKAGTDVDVVHIDLNEGVPKACSVSDEFYKPIEHIRYTQEVEDWAIAFGLPRNATAELLKLIPDEDERYVYANGGAAPGSTPDAQVVKCPVCGRPTWAAPASVGFKNVIGEYVPNTDDSKQMTCEHCQASLAECFSGDNKFDTERIFLNKERFYKSEDEVE